MIPKDLPIRSSLRWLSLIILVMMVPWLIAYVTGDTFFTALMALYWLTPIGTILMAFSLALIIGIIYGCLSTALSDPYTHLKAFAYAHGIFTSTTSLSLLYTFVFTRQDDWNLRFPESLRFTIPLWIALPVYFSLYTVYVLLAYRSLSEIVDYHSRRPLKDVVRYWRLGAIFCLLTAIVIIIVIIRNLLNPEKLFIGNYTPPEYVVIILAIVGIVLLILSLDELFFGGRFRRIRYPILAPLIAHTAWVLTPVRGAVLPSSWTRLFIIFSGMFPLPGIITAIGPDHVLTCMTTLKYLNYVLKAKIMYVPPNIILFTLGFWLFFEFIAFYKMLTFTSVKTSIREVLDFILDVLKIKLITVRIKARAFRDGMLVIYVVNESYNDITDFKAYLIGVDWASLDKPLILDLKLEGREEIVKISSGSRVILICEDWSFGRRVYADEVLSIKITYRIGEKPVEKVFTIPIT